ncbi:MAG: hypothetical protein SPL13_04290 [Clostridia bacterium]|nr:hypothetical protein [Clostridia bacterium]
MQKNIEIFQDYITETSEPEEKPIDCNTCKRFFDYSEGFCPGESDLYYCRRYKAKDKQCLQ